MEYILGRYVKFARYGNGGLIGGGSKEQLIDELDLWEKIVQTAYCFLEPQNYDRAQEVLRNTISEEQFSNCFNFLKKTILSFRYISPKILREIVTPVTICITKAMGLTLKLYKKR